MAKAKNPIPNDLDEIIRIGKAFDDPKSPDNVISDARELLAGYGTSRNIIDMAKEIIRLRKQVKKLSEKARRYDGLCE